MKSTDLSRAQLIGIIGVLRGTLYDDTPDNIEDIRAATAFDVYEDIEKPNLFNSNPRTGTISKMEVEPTTFQYVEMGGHFWLGRRMHSV